MKLACRCGYVISDVTDNLPFKAEVIADQDWERTWGVLIESFTELAAAARDGREAEWVHRTGAFAAQELGSVIADFIVGVEARYGRTIYQCENCKRLWLQVRNQNEASDSYVSFIPEDSAGGIVLGTAAVTPKNQT